MDDDVPRGDCRQRTAASKVPAQQKKLQTVDSDDGENATDSEPESVPSKFSSIKTPCLDVLWMWCLTFRFYFQFNAQCFYFIFPPPLLKPYFLILVTSQLHFDTKSKHWSLLVHIPQTGKNYTSSLHLLQYIRTSFFCPLCPGMFCPFKEPLFIFLVVVWGLHPNSDYGVKSGVSAFSIGFV